MWQWLKSFVARQLDYTSAVLPTLAFLIAFYLVFELFILSFGGIFAACTSSNLLTFLTSPVSLCENIYYGTSPSANLYGNFVFFCVLITFVSFYIKYFKVDKKRIGILTVLLSAVLASYILSGLYWFDIGLPSEGTSIAAFSLLIFLGISFVQDLQDVKKIRYTEYYLSHKDKGWVKWFATRLKLPVDKYIHNLWKKRAKLQRETTIIGVFAVLVAAFGFYILDNTSVLNHLSGGFIFVTILYAQSKLKISFDREFKKRILFVTFSLLGFAILVSANYAYNHNVIVGVFKINQYNQTGNVTSLGLFKGFYTEPDSIVNISIPCTAKTNLTLENLTLKTKNFTLIGTWPKLPTNLKAGCGSSITITLKVPSKPIIQNLSIDENVSNG